MRRLRALRLSTVMVVALVAVLGAEVGQAVAETFLVPQENAMQALVNDLRREHGLNGLSTNESLRWIGRRQSQRMSSSGSIFHNPSLANEADASALPWTDLGENVGKGLDEQRIENAFESSPTHRANILHPRFDAMGVGGIAGDGAIYMTQIYAGLDGAPAAKSAAPAAAAVPPKAAPAPQIPLRTLAPTRTAPPATPRPAVPTPAPAAAATPAAALTPAPDPVAVSDPAQEPAPARPSFLEMLVDVFASLFERVL